MSTMATKREHKSGKTRAEQRHILSHIGEYVDEVDRLLSESKRVSTQAHAVMARNREALG